jgi:hypothetical protein
MSRASTHPDPAAGPRTRLRSCRAARAAAIAGAAILGIVVAGLPVYVFPAVDRPARADVIDVIGPVTPSRLRTATELVSEGRGGALVITVAPHFYPESDAASIPECNEPQSVPVYCVIPEPNTTQGESRALAKLAEEHGWRSAIVVTARPHVTRARAIVSLCFPGSVDVVADPQRFTVAAWAYQYAYQTVGFLKLAYLIATERRGYCGA